MTPPRELLDAHRYATYRVTAITATVAAILGRLGDRDWIGMAVWLVVLVLTVRAALRDRRDRISR
jgi:hypothetical protein